MLTELRNVVNDVMSANASVVFPVEHRGHVIAVAYMCALDAVSAYGYKNRRVERFIKNHFPPAYKPHAKRIYPEYRVSLVHTWNLFGDVALLPGHEQVIDIGGQLEFGILNFADAFEAAVNDFLSKLATDTTLQNRALHRYRVVTGKIERRPSRLTRRDLAAAAIGVALGLGVAGAFAMALRFASK